VLEALARLAIICYRIFMMRSIADNKKKRGRPKTGIGPAVGLRLYPDLEQRLDAWIAKQSDPDLGRPEAIRRLLDQALEATAPLRPAGAHASKPAAARKARQRRS
jgi:hypothetical protein